MVLMMKQNGVTFSTQSNHILSSLQCDNKADSSIDTALIGIK